MPITTVVLVCSVCKKEFTRGAAEAARNKKAKRKIYCSPKCLGIAHAAYLGSHKESTNKNLDPRNHIDEYSPFRAHLNSIRQRAKEKCLELTITLCDLKDQWESQRGICPYTGWFMANPATCGVPRLTHPRRASVDRINPAAGYVPGNIQFVAYIANIAKHRFSSDDLIDFCKAVVMNLENKSLGEGI